MSGAAYVFTKSGTVWNQTGERRLPTRSTNGFAWSVSTTGTTAVVGDPFRVVGGNSEGAAYVFTKSGSTWAQKSMLTSPFGATGDE